MSIDGLNKFQFLQATNPYGNYQPAKNQGVDNNQNYFTKPIEKTTQSPSISLPSTEDMEKAMAFINATEGVKENPFVDLKAQPKGVDSSKGLAWGEGFSVPQNNGTGELQPESRDEEHGKKFYVMG